MKGLIDTVKNFMISNITKDRLINYIIGLLSGFTVAALIKIFVGS